MPSSIIAAYTWHEVQISESLTLPLGVPLSLSLFDVIPTYSEARKWVPMQTAALFGKWRNLAVTL